MKLNKKHIPYFAAVVQTAQYALAGYFLIGVMGWFFVGIMGALISLALAYGASQFADIAQRRKGSSLTAMVIIMCFSPILIGTATWIHLTIIPNPYWRGVVSLVWGALPDLAVALSGFIAGKGLVEQGSQPLSTPSGRSAKGKTRSAKSSKVRTNISCRYAPQCDRTFVSQNAANAHARTCGFKPTVAMPAEQKAESKP
jgi:hypothetical protein